MTSALDRVRGRAEVASITSWYDAPAAARVPPVCGAGRLRLAGDLCGGTLRSGDEDSKLRDLDAIEGYLRAGEPVHTDIGGAVPFLKEANEQTARDIVLAETISLPVLLVLLVVIFGGLVAASTPLVIAGWPSWERS